MAEPPARPRGELVFLVVLLGVAVAAVVEAQRLGGFARLSGAGIFPMLASVVMAVSLLLLIGAELQAAWRGGRVTGAWAAVVPLRLVAVVALIAAYAAAMPYLGFMAATGLFLLATLLYLWRRGLWRSLAVTAAALVAIQLVFREVFQVVLPGGTLWPGGFW